jgi:protein involved in temperature-dependent protein secretion
MHVGEAACERAAQLAMLGRDARRSSDSLQVQAEAALMQLDDARALALASRAVAENPTNGEAHAVLAAAEALSGDAEAASAQMAISRRLLPVATIDNFDEWRRSTEPRYVAARARLYEGLRAAGMPQR